MKKRANEVNWRLATCGVCERCEDTKVVVDGHCVRCTDNNYIDALEKDKINVQDHERRIAELESKVKDVRCYINTPNLIG